MALPHITCIETPDCFIRKLVVVFLKYLLGFFFPVLGNGRGLEVGGFGEEGGRSITADGEYFTQQQLCISPLESERKV